jgi:NADP-dependent 3-hydroxy acid dehydrogenase YdfG
VKAITDGLRIDVAHTALRVTNLKPGLVETNFSNVRFHGDEGRAATVYKGIKPLTGDDIADVAVYAANAPEHVQIAEVLILATHQASGSVIIRK